MEKYLFTIPSSVQNNHSLRDLEKMEIFLRDLDKMEIFWKISKNVLGRFGASCSGNHPGRKKTKLMKQQVQEHTHKSCSSIGSNYGKTERWL